VKVRDDGKAAIVHDFPTTPSGISNITQNFFIVYWKNMNFPSVTNGCGGGICQQVDNSCLRDITGVPSPVFTSLPGGASEILEKLRAGHADPRLYDDKTFVSKDGNGYKYHLTNSASCCASLYI
jgi:hypothetical protein